MLQVQQQIVVTVRNLRKRNLIITIQYSIQNIYTQGNTYSRHFIFYLKNSLNNNHISQN